MDEEQWRYERWGHTASGISPSLGRLLHSLSAGSFLYGYCIHTDSPCRHSLQIANVIIGPDLAKFRTQCAPTVHISIALHPCRRAPGGGKQKKRATGNSLGLMNGRQYPACFPGNIEALELGIKAVYIAVVLQAEIA